MRILLFGAGSGLNDFLSIVPEEVEIIGLADNDVRKHGTMIHGQTVCPPDSILQKEFDFIVITTRTGEAIRNQLVSRGVERQKILLYHPSFDAELRTLVNKDLAALNRELGTNLHPISLCTMPAWPISQGIQMNSEDDYCRLMSIRLAAERIVTKNVPGSIAELGVYKGHLAAVLNQLFADRRLYLFDTFEGFSGHDLAGGIEKQHSRAAVGDFNDTSLDLVLSKMRHPQNVTVRKGYFPETAAGLEEDTFAFVSLDVDLYKPTIAGLNYFYPRLSKGGCIFVHDYNNRRYNGVQSAVEEFLETSKASVVQIPDFAGSAIIPK